MIAGGARRRARELDQLPIADRQSASLWPLRLDQRVHRNPRFVVDSGHGLASRDESEVRCRRCSANSRGRSHPIYRIERPGRWTLARKRKPALWHNAQSMVSTPDTWRLERRRRCAHLGCLCQLRYRLGHRRLHPDPCRLLRYLWTQTLVRAPLHPWSLSCAGWRSLQVPLRGADDA